MKVGSQESTGSKNLAFSLWNFQRGNEKRKREQVYTEHLEELCALCGCVFYLIFTTVIGHKYYPLDHTDKDTEAQRV